MNRTLKVSLQVLSATLLFLCSNLLKSGMALASERNLVSSASGVRRRADGVIVHFDPYAPEMMEKYGRPGETDDEGFNPYRDTVGPGIYGGIVARNERGEIVIGEQFQQHNPNPGPVYAGGGYTPMSQALHDEKMLLDLLGRHPELVSDVSTGGATPLHMCGMSQSGSRQTAIIIQKGGDIEAVDTYGFRPLHRMASNNLAIGALALLEAGADVFARTDRGETAMSIARSAGAGDVLKVLAPYLKRN